MLRWVIAFSQILDGENGENSDSDEDDEELEINEMAAESLKGRKSAKKKIETNLNPSVPPVKLLTRDKVADSFEIFLLRWLVK